MSTPVKPITWKTRTQSIELGDLPCIMGIVNVTPDSFSDGGKYFDAQTAVAHALNLVEQGAGILDIGGESTRPYSEPVDVDVELDRVLPVIEQVCRQTSVPVSIDTSHADVARAAIQAGAEIINDVTGLEGDPLMIEVALETGAGICAMHMQGTPQTMQDNPHYENVVEEILEYLRQRKQVLSDRGIAPEKICLDPGIGFGKTHEHNLLLLAHASRFLETGSPILVGHSRKGFVRKFSKDESDERVAGTLAVSLWLAQQGIHVLRVHDVLQTRQGLLMQRAISQAGHQPQAG